MFVSWGHPFLGGFFKEETNHQAAQYNLSAISGPLGALIRHQNPSAFQFTGLCKNCGKKVKRVKRRPVGNFRQAPPRRGTSGRKSAKKDRGQRSSLITPLLPSRVEDRSSISLLHLFSISCGGSIGLCEQTPKMTRSDRHRSSTNPQFPVLLRELYISHWGRHLPVSGDQVIKSPSY